MPESTPKQTDKLCEQKPTEIVRCANASRASRFASGFPLDLSAAVRWSPARSEPEEHPRAFGVPAFRNGFARGLFVSSQLSRAPRWAYWQPHPLRRCPAASPDQLEALRKLETVEGNTDKVAAIALGTSSATHF